MRAVALRSSTTPAAIAATAANVPSLAVIVAMAAIAAMAPASNSRLLAASPASHQVWSSPSQASRCGLVVLLVRRPTRRSWPNTRLARCSSKLPRPRKCRPMRRHKPRCSIFRRRRPALPRLQDRGRPVFPESTPPPPVPHTRIRSPWSPPSTP